MITPKNLELLREIRIEGGPSKIDPLEALFFNQKILEFTLKEVYVGFRWKQLRLHVIALFRGRRPGQYNLVGNSLDQYDIAWRDEDQARALGPTFIAYDTHRRVGSFALIDETFLIQDFFQPNIIDFSI